MNKPEANEKEAILGNILNMLSVFQKKFEDHKQSLYEMEQESEAKTAEELRKPKKDAEKLKVDDEKEIKKSSSLVKTLVTTFFVGLFATLPMLIRLFNDSKDFILSFPEKCMKIYSNVANKTVELLNEYVIDPFTDIIKVKIPAITNTISIIIGDSIQSILYVPLSIMNQAQVYIEEAKLNIVSRLLNIMVDYRISAFIPLESLQTKLEENKLKYIKKIEVLNEEQKQRQIEIEAAKGTSYKDVYTQEVTSKEQQVSEQQKQPEKPEAKPEKPTKEAKDPGEILKESDSSDLLKFASKNDSGVNVDKIHPELKRRVTAVAAAIKEQTGQKLIITSGYRSNEKQKELWEAKVREYGGDTSLPYPYGLSSQTISQIRWKVAPPMPIGKGSLHFKGLAMDLNSKQLNTFAGSRGSSTGWLEKFGLIRPIPGEDWHVQLDGTPPSSDNPDNPGSPVQVANDDANKSIKLADGKTEPVNKGNNITKASMEAKIEKPEPEDVVIVQQENEQQSQSLPATKPGSYKGVPEQKKTNNAALLYKNVMEAA